MGKNQLNQRRGVRRRRSGAVGFGAGVKRALVGGVDITARREQERRGRTKKKCWRVVCSQAGNEGNRAERKKSQFGERQSDQWRGKAESMEKRKPRNGDSVREGALIKILMHSIWEKGGEYEIGQKKIHGGVKVVGCQRISTSSIQSKPRLSPRGRTREEQHHDRGRGGLRR